MLLRFMFAECYVLVIQGILVSLKLEGKIHSESFGIHF